MPKNTKPKKESRYLEKLSASFGGLFEKIVIDTTKTVKSIESGDPKAKSIIDKHIRKLLSFESKVNSALKLYELDLDEFALTRESFSIIPEIDDIAKNLRKKPVKTKTDIETKLDNNIPEVTINKELFQKWIFWAINRMFSHPDIIHVLVDARFVNDQIIIKVTPKRVVKQPEIHWEGIDWILSERYFQLENGSLKVLDKGGIEITLTVIAQKHEPISTEKALESKDILKKVHEGIDLPTLSPIAAKVIRLASDEKTSAQQLASVITLDPALTAKLLKLVNSPLYGFKKEITTLSQAVALLGMKAVRTMSLCVSIFDAFPTGTAEGLDYNDFWQRSLASAIAAKYTAQKLGIRIDEEAFIAGLTQNVGCLIFERFIPEQYGKIYSRHYTSSEELVAMEEENWGLNHSMLGYEVFTQWKMPVLLAQTLLHHHKPDSVPANNESLALLVKIINASDLVAQVLYTTENTGLNLQKLKDRFKEFFNLGGVEVDDIMEHVSGEIDTVAKDFEFKIDKPADYAKVLQSANIELGKINLDYEQMLRELQLAKNKAEKLTSELKIVNKKLEEKAVTDSLTNLYNHRFFFEMLNKEFANSRRHGRPLGCVMIDIDFFKKVNDNYGHQEGDKVLKVLGEMLLDAVREGDVPARYGGEEFSLILSNTPTTEAVKVAERIRKHVETTAFSKKLDAGKITISVGVVGMDSTKVKSAAEFAECADKAVYASKDNGRNMVTLYSKDLEKKS
ncbi:MAG: GGDEF domain-containing protein [bacterium]|nr:GGDEF domain-containing protein [bacterium]